MCRRNGKARLDREVQASHNCTLPGFDRSTWTGEKLLPIWMGARPRYGVSGRDIHTPLEDIEREGCPGAWTRTPFLRSLLTYYRRRDEHGGRVANRALDDCDDPLVHDAIAELEAHEETARADYLERKYRQEGGAA